MKIPNQSNVSFNAMMPQEGATPGQLANNTVNTEILSYAVTKTIRSDKTTVREGENARIAVTVVNRSATKLFDHRFAVPQPDGGNYVAGSVKVNGIAQPSYDPVTGFPLPDLSPDETVEIEYEIKANDPMTTTPITQFATLNYTVNDPVRGDVNYSENTDTVFVDVIADKISVVKSVDKSYAVKGEKLHYTVTVTNIGSAMKSDLVFKDSIPTGTTFVKSSIKINGKSYSDYHPESGFAIPSLAPNEAFTVEFDVEVN